MSREETTMTEETMSLEERVTYDACKRLKRELPSAPDSTIWFALSGCGHPGHLLTKALNAIAGEGLANGFGHRVAS